MMSDLLITAAELKEQLDHYRVIDCRFSLSDPASARFVYLTGHIPGASFADLEAELSAPPFSGLGGRHPLPDEEQFTCWLQRQGITPDQPVVVYDDAGGAMAATRLWWMLRWAGHTRVRLLDGGLNAWRAAGGGLTAALSPVAPSRWQPLYHHDWVVTTEELCQRLSDDALTLVDARDYRRFLGDPNPLDPVAGHIPGALSRPFMDNLTPSGFFQPVAQLQERFADLDGEVVCYCGSGVTACHNLFALCLSGHPMPRLYVGSWSDWICDPRHPVARGPQD